MIQPHLIALPKRAPYKPILSVIERRAFAAAHEIVTLDTAFREVACPGAKRSRQVEAIAEVIQRAFEGMESG